MTEKKVGHETFAQDSFEGLMRMAPFAAKPVQKEPAEKPQKPLDKVKSEK